MGLFLFGNIRLSLFARCFSIPPHRVVWLPIGVFPLALCGGAILNQKVKIEGRAGKARVGGLNNISGAWWKGEGERATR